MRPVCPSRSCSQSNDTKALRGDCWLGCRLKSPSPAAGRIALSVKCWVSEFAAFTAQGRVGGNGARLGQADQQRVARLNLQQVGQRAVDDDLRGPGGDWSLFAPCRQKAGVQPIKCTWLARRAEPSVSRLC